MVGVGGEELELSDSVDDRVFGEEGGVFMEALGSVEVSEEMSWSVMFGSGGGGSVAEKFSAESKICEEKLVGEGISGLLAEGVEVW